MEEMGVCRVACLDGTAGVNCRRASFADGVTGSAAIGFWALCALSMVLSGSSSSCGMRGRLGVGNVVRCCGCRVGMEGWEGTRGLCPMEPSWVVSSNSSLMGCSLLLCCVCECLVAVICGLLRLLDSASRVVREALGPYGFGAAPCRLCVQGLRSGVVLAR